MSRKALVVAKSKTRTLVAQASDRELVDGVLRSSEEHFNALYERYFQRVYSFVYLRLRNHADSEEVVQEVFTAAFRSVGSWKGTASFSSWLYGIAKNTANNHIRRSKAQDLRIERAQSEQIHSHVSFGHSTPEDFLNLHRCEDTLRERLQSISTWHAEAFVLRHFEDLSIDEIAAKVLRSNDAVRSSLYRTKKLLVEAMGSGLQTAG
ncbi:MAG: RNA polymerase sigma factor [Myxococcota bacterium]|nr:RNA polymerase sigma factor [Myxococcota bacterium]